MLKMSPYIQPLFAECIRIRIRVDESRYEFMDLVAASMRGANKLTALNTTRNMFFNMQTKRLFVLQANQVINKFWMHLHLHFN